MMRKTARVDMAQRVGERLDRAGFLIVPDEEGEWL